MAFCGLAQARGGAALVRLGGAVRLALVQLCSMYGLTVIPHMGHVIAWLLNIWQVYAPFVLTFIDVF